MQTGDADRFTDALGPDRESGFRRPPTTSTGVESPPTSASRR